MNIDRKIYECLAGGISDKTWDSYKVNQKEDYIKAHPFSKRAERRFPNPVIRNNVNCFKPEFNISLSNSLSNFAERYVEDWYLREIDTRNEYAEERIGYRVKSFDGYDDLLESYIDQGYFDDIIGDICKSHNLPHEFSENYVVNALLDKKDLYQEADMDDCIAALKILLGDDLNKIYNDMKDLSDGYDEEIFG